MLLCLCYAERGEGCDGRIVMRVPGFEWIKHETLNRIIIIVALIIPCCLYAGVCVGAIWVHRMPLSVFSLSAGYRVDCTCWRPQSVFVCVVCFLIGVLKSACHKRLHCCYACCWYCRCHRLPVACAWTPRRYVWWSVELECAWWVKSYATHTS